MSSNNNPRDPQRAAWSGGDSPSGAAASSSPVSVPMGVENASDDAPPSPPGQIAAEYEDMEAAIQECGAPLDDAPIPPAQIDALIDENKPQNTQADEPSSPSNFVESAAMNELVPPIPFNPAAVEDNKIAADDSSDVQVSSIQTEGEDQPPSSHHVRSRTIRAFVSAQDI